MQNSSTIIRYKYCHDIKYVYTTDLEVEIDLYSRKSKPIGISAIDFKEAQVSMGYKLS